MSTPVESFAHHHAQHGGTERAKRHAYTNLTGSAADAVGHCTMRGSKVVMSRWSLAKLVPPQCWPAGRNITGEISWQILRFDVEEPGDDR